MSDATEVDARDPLIGQVLQDRYRVVRRLGTGGMGAVYEGEHLLIKKRVAIKALHSQFATSPEVVARFQQEALAATAIGHEHIVEVNDMGRLPDGAFFMVLEYLAGRDFADLIEKEGPLTIGRTVHIVAQMCDALQAAHDKGIVHRDLKPENVFLIKRSGNPDFAKVLDFGISKVQDAEAGSSRGMTKTGAIMGTAYYMAPEQAMGKKTLDHRADIWAIGVIIFRALTRTYPFDDEAFPMLVVKVCSFEPPPLRAFRPDVPAALEAVIRRCLSKEPSDRYPNCDALRDALSPYRGMLDMPELGDGVKTMSERPGMPIDAFARTGISVPDGQGATDPDARSALRSQLSPAVGPATTSPGLPSSRRRIGFAIGGLAIVGVGIAALVVLNAGGGVTTAVSEVPGWVVPREAALTDPRGAQRGDTPSDTRAGSNAPRLDVPVTPQLVTIHVSTTPTRAQLFLDDRPISNPFDAEMPASGQLHKLEARADGYRTWVQDLTLEYAQRVPIAMTRGRGTQDTRQHERGAAPGTAGWQSGETPSAPPTEQARVEPTAAAAVPEVHVEPPTPEPQPIQPVAAPPPQTPVGSGIVPPPHGLKRIRIP